MDTKLATMQTRIQQWAAIIHDRHKSGLCTFEQIPYKKGVRKLFILMILKNR